MQKCPSCASAVPDGMKFCTQCGSKLGDAAPAAPTPTAEKQPATPAPVKPMTPAPTTAPAPTPAPAPAPSMPPMPPISKPAATQAKAPPPPPNAAFKPTKNPPPPPNAAFKPTKTPPPPPPAATKAPLPPVNTTPAPLPPMKATPAPLPPINTTPEPEADTQKNPVVVVDSLPQEGAPVTLAADAPQTPAPSQQAPDMWDAIEAATPAPASEAPNEVAVNIQTLDEPEDFNATVKEDVSKIIAETQPKQESAISKKVIHGAPPPVEQADAQEADSQAVRVSLDPNVQVETSRSTIEAMPSVIVDEIYKQKIVGTRSSMDENAQPSKEEPLIELQESLLVGQQFGQYKIEGLLHKTDFGAVYKAQHTYLQQTAHLEVFPLKQGDSTKLSEDFRKFATKYMQFKHPYAVQWTDFGEIPKTGFYAVKEQFESKSLAERFASREPFPTHRIRRIIEQLTHVLEKAHLSDFLHEDIRPENVHITLNALGEETIKLGGFGIQSVYKKHNCRPLSKEIRHRMAQYNSPEQDKAPRFVGPRSDLYSLGVLLFELLTGRPPFNESDTSLLLKDHVITPPPTLKEVASWEKWHPELEAFILTALAKESAGRPAGIAAFRDACLQAIDAQLQKDFVSASGSHPALPAVGQQAAQTAQQPDPSAFLSTPAPAQELGGFDEQEFDRDFSAFDALDDDLPSSNKNMMLPIMLGVIAVLLIAIWFFLPSGKKTDNKNPNRRTKVTKRTPSEPRETKVGMTNVERRTPPPKRVEEPPTETPDAAAAPDVSEPSTPPPARRIERRPPPVRRRRIVRPRRRIVRPRRRVIIARRRAPSPLAGKANALKKAFTSWKSSHKLHYKDITGASRLYSKARSLMKKRKYSAAISTLEALKKKFGNYAKLTRPVMQKKFSRLQAAHKWAKKKKRVPEGTLKSVENQQFPKIYMFFMKGNFTSMNKAMNKAFTTLKTNPSRFSP